MISTFDFNGNNSKEFNMYINAELTLSSSQPDYSTIEVPGRDGDLILPNNRYKSFSQTVSVIFLGGYNDTMSKIEQVRRWLLSDTEFHDFKLSSDPDYTYRAAYLGNFEIKKATDELSADLSFEMMPYKYLNSGLGSQTISSGTTLTNSGSIPALPLLKITCSGDITVSLGSQTLSLKGVDTGIILDCESQLCTSLDGTRTQFDKLYSDFPNLPVGNTKISWSGAVSDFEIAPRWKVRT
jgi:predicted phage tail component-like protein